MARSEARIVDVPPHQVLTYGQYQRKPAGERHSIRVRQLAHQQGRCALCDVLVEGRAIHGMVADHCHITGRLRGVLCGACNLAMAAIDRGDDWIARAVHYRESGAWLREVGV